MTNLSHAGVAFSLQISFFLGFDGTYCRRFITGDVPLLSLQAGRSANIHLHGLLGRVGVFVFISHCSFGFFFDTCTCSFGLWALCAGDGQLSAINNCARAGSETGIDIACTIYTRTGGSKEKYLFGTVKRGRGRIGKPDAQRTNFVAEHT
jgi:hypothetical protein